MHKSDAEYLVLKQLEDNPHLTQREMSKIVTLSGFKEDNPLRKSGDINLWVNSRAYNFVENIHQIWLLSLVDLIIGDKVYSA